MSESDAVKFHRRAGFLLATLGRRSERSWGAFLRERGLSTAEFTAMTVVAEAGSPANGINQGELALRMGIDARNAGAVVARLRERGWIEVGGDPGDGRVRVLALSEAGRAGWRGLQRELAGQRSDYLRALTAAEVAELERLLNKLNDDHLARG